jgi:DNA-binding HxlR family transcriptional regulator
MAMGDARYLQRARDLRHLLNGDWVSDILVALSGGPLHYKELYTAVKESSTFDPWTGAEHPIPRRTLTRTLRRLEAAGLVLRHEEQVFPRSVVYSLTPAATELLVSVRPLIHNVLRLCGPDHRAAPKPGMPMCSPGPPDRNELQGSGSSRAETTTGHPAPPHATMARPVARVADLTAGPHRLRAAKCFGRRTKPAAATAPSSLQSPQKKYRGVETQPE